MTSEYKRELEAAITDLQERVKRLESPEGADRRLVPQERSDEGQGDGEQRSAEGCAVPPGEVRAAIAEARRKFLREAASADEGAERFRQMGARTRQEFWAGMAAAYYECAWHFNEWEPEPDSDADDPCPSRMPGNDRSSASPDNQEGKRSVRRNDEPSHPTE